MQSFPSFFQQRTTFEANGECDGLIMPHAVSCSMCTLTSSIIVGPGHKAQLVTCLATDASVTANPGVASSIPTRSHTFCGD